MGFYDEMRAVASDVFAEFQQGTIRYIGLMPATGGTPDDPGEPTETATVLNATAVPVSTRYIDGTIITGTETQVSMPNDDVVPEMSGFVEIDGLRYKIVRIMARPAAGVPVSFTLIVKR